ncbi:MAG: hypothetical protein AM324_004050 [Candidatus Thorarchaeota archaeon SMTZ1-83]|nr:MAG: hypothetical protein AM324_05160 [Candidatus Thorarchaeota archaeon SMTZ1-83]
MRRVAWVAFLSCLLNFHCSRDYPLFEKPEGRFPLSVGNRWELSRETRWEFFDGVPPGIEYPLVYRSTVYWEIVARDFLKGYGSYVLKNEWYEIGGERDFSLHWYTDSWKGDPGLYRIGYTWGGGVPPPKLPQGHRLKLGDYEFGFWEEIPYLSSVQCLAKEDIFVIIPPEVVLEWPLEVGMEWMAHRSPLSTVRKKVVDRETVVTGAGTFSCYRIEVIREFGPLFLLDPLVSYEWFSDEGLVKRSTEMTGEWTDPYGNPSGTFVVTDVYLLESYCIRE